jgi:LacI family transcriptional regulator
MRKAGIEDVARAAGVSTTTVSRVLNAVPTVSEANRQRVLEAIRKLNYRPNPSAQRLAAGRNNTVGLVIPRFSGIFRSFYISELIKGVGTATERLKLDLLLHVTNGRTFINLATVEGFLFADIDGNEEQLDWVMDQKIPCVVMNHYIQELPVSCIAINNRAAAQQIVNHLIKLGHREIATITGHLRTPVGIERLEGYLDTLKANHLEVKPHFVEHGDYTGASARLAARRLLTHQDRPTAIFAASDEMAVTTIEVALELGLRVPEELSVVGFDDSPIAAFAKVPLTTVSQPLSEVGERSVEVLHSLIRGKRRHPVKKLLGTKLVERQSCRQTWLEPHG